MAFVPDKSGSTFVPDAPAVKATTFKPDVTLAAPDATAPTTPATPFPTSTSPEVNAPAPSAVATTFKPDRAPSAMEHTQPPDEVDNSAAEDLRRIGEWATHFPRRAAAGVVRGFEAVTDIPASELVMGGPKAVKDYATKAGGPSHVNDATAPISYGQGYAMQPGTTPLEDRPESKVDIDLGYGVSARQALNIALDKTLGRAVRFGQRVAGNPAAQMAYTGTKELSSAIDEADAQSKVTPFPTSDSPTTNWGPQSGAVPPPSAASQLGPEAHEHLSKTLLSVLGGETFYAPDNSPLKANAEQQMIREYGDTGAKVVEASAQLLAQWPIMLFPGAEASWAAAPDAAIVEQAMGSGPAAMKALLPAASDAALRGPVLQGIASGTTQGLYMAAAKEGQDYAENAGYGGLLGGILGLAGGMWRARQLPRELGASLKQPHQYVKTLYGDVPVASEATNFQPVREFKSGEKYIANDEVPAVVIIPKTMQELSAQLDEAIAKAAPKVTKGIHADLARMKRDIKQETAGRKMAQQVTVPDTQAGSGEFSFDTREARPGERVVPSFSVPTIDAEGRFVMRDHGITAGPGQAKLGRLGTAHSTNITSVYKDTPVKSAPHLRDLLQGRSVNFPAMSDEAAAVFDAARAQLRKEFPMYDYAGVGTPKYQSPEQAGPGLNTRIAQGEVSAPALVKMRQAEAARLKAADPGGRQTAQVMTMSPHGHVKLTAIAPTTPRPVDTVKFRPGDFIQVDGPGGYKAIAEGTTPEGNVIIRGPTGNLHEVAASTARLSMDTDIYQARLDLDRALSKGAGRGDPTGASPRLKAIIQANESATVPDVLRWEGRSPKDLGWAVGVLRNMEAQGALRETSPGVFSPTRRWEPKNPDIDPKAKGGQFVYYDTGVQPGSGATAGDHPAGSGRWGVLRGPDVRRPGNWIIEVPAGHAAVVSDPNPDIVAKYAKTTHISVPEEVVRTKWPVLMADKSRINPGIDMYGWTKPMPPGFVQAPAGNVDDVAKMSTAWSRSFPPSLMSQSKGVVQKVIETFVGAAHQSDPLIRASAGQRLFAAPHVMRSEALAMTAKLDAQLGGRGSAANTELTKLLELNRSQSPGGAIGKTIDPQALQQWAKQYPKEAASSLRDIKLLTALNDQYSKVLAQRGAGNVAYLEARRSTGDIPEYLTTNYAAFQMPRRDWAEFAHKNLTTEWRDAVDWMVEQYPGRDASTVSQDLDAILRLDNPIKGFEEKGYIKAEAKAKLGEKVDVPLPIRRLLGEHKDASIKLAFSVAYKRQLVKGIQSWDAIAVQPELWSPGYRADMTLQIPDDPLFGGARNGYVNDNAATRQLLEGRRLSNIGDGSTLLRGMGWLGQKWKTGHTVYNQVAWVNNTIRNLKGVLLSGGFAGPEDMQGFRDAARMLADYHTDPTVYGPNKLLVEAMDYDAVGPGLAGAELGAEQRKFQRKIFDYYRKTQASGWLQSIEGVRDVALAVPESIHGGYDTIDKVAKFGSYLNIRRKLIALGHSMDDAAALASLRINLRFPNFTQTPDWVRRTVAGGGNFSLLAPYATSKLEDSRINGQLVRDLMVTMSPGPRGPDHDPELVWRVLGLTATIGGAATLALHTRRMNGISDAEDLQQRSTIPLKSQKYSHFLIGSLDYDPHGRRVFLPVDSYEDLLMSFQGNVKDAPLANLFTNQLMGITGEDGFQGMAVQSLGAQLGARTGQDIDMTPRADQTGLLNTALKYGPAFLPQAPFVASKAIDRGSPSGRLVNPEAWTPDQQLVRGLGGQSPIPVGPATTTQTLMETAQNVGSRAKDVGAAALDAALHNVSIDRQKYMIESNVRELRKSVNVPRPLKPGGSK